MTHKLHIHALLLLLAASTGWGATYYVSQTGAGAATGADVDNASAVAAYKAGTAPYNDLDGDTVYLLDAITSNVSIPDGGSTGSVVTIRGDYPGHACTINVGGVGNPLTISKSYVTVIGLVLTGSQYHGCWVNNTNNVVLENVSAIASKSHGFYLYTSYNVTLNNCTSTGNGPGDSFNGCELDNSYNITITGGSYRSNYCGVFSYLSPGTHDVVITGADISYNKSDGIHFEGGAYNIVATHCWIEGNGTSDFAGNGDGWSNHLYSSQPSTGNVLAYSVLLKNRNTGVADTGGSALIYNNIFCQNGDSTATNMGNRGGFYCTGHEAVHTLRNNIFMGNYPYEIAVIDSRAVPYLDLDFNVYYHQGNGVTETAFANIATMGGVISWATYHASYEAHSQYGDPLFLSPTTGDFRLKTGSPCINAGTNLGATYDDDFLGYDQDRYGSGWEIGAYVYRPRFLIKP